MRRVACRIGRPLLVVPPPVPMLNKLLFGCCAPIPALNWNAFVGNVGAAAPAEKLNAGAAAGAVAGPPPKLNVVSAGAPNANGLPASPTGAEVAPNTGEANGEVAPDAGPPNADADFGPKLNAVLDGTGVGCAFGPALNENGETAASGLALLKNAPFVGAVEYN